jgi:hypothetical protein
LVLNSRLSKLVLSSTVIFVLCVFLIIFKLFVLSGFLLLIYGFVSFHLVLKKLTIRIPSINLIIAILAFFSIAIIIFLPDITTNFYKAESLYDIALFSIPALYLCTFFTGYAVSSIFRLKLPRLLGFLFSIFLSIFVSALINLASTSLNVSSQLLLLVIDLILAISLIVLRNDSFVFTSVNFKPLLFITFSVMGIVVIFVSTLTNLVNFNGLDMWTIFNYAVPMLRGVTQPWAIPGGYTSANYPSLGYNFVASYLSLVPGDAALAFLLLFPLGLLPFVSFFAVARRLTRDFSEAALATLLYLTIAGISWIYLLTAVRTSSYSNQVVFSLFNKTYDNYLSWALPLYGPNTVSVIGIGSLFLLVALLVDQKVSLRNLLICGSITLILDFSIHTQEIFPLFAVLFVALLVARQNSIRYRISLFCLSSAGMVVVFALILQPSSYFQSMGLLELSLLIGASLFSNILIVWRGKLSGGMKEKYRALHFSLLVSLSALVKFLSDFTAFLITRFGIGLALVVGALICLKNTVRSRTVYHAALYLCALMAITIGAYGLSVLGVIAKSSLYMEILGRFIVPGVAIILSILFLHLWRVSKHRKGGFLIRLTIIGLIFTLTFSTFIIASTWSSFAPSPTSSEELAAFSFLRTQLNATDYVVAPSPDTQAKLYQFAGITYQSLFEQNNDFFSSADPTFVLFLISHPRPNAPGQIRYVFVTPEDQALLHTIYSNGFFVKTVMPSLTLVYSKDGMQIFYVPDLSMQIDPTQKLVITPDTSKNNQAALELAESSVNFGVTDLANNNLGSSSTIMLSQDPTPPIWIGNFSESWVSSGNITRTVSNDITTITSYSTGTDSWATISLPVSISSVGESPYVTLIAEGQGIEAPFFVEFRNDIGQQYSSQYVQGNLSRSIFTSIYFPMPVDMRVTSVRIGFHFFNNSQAGYSSVAIKWLGIGFPVQNLLNWVMTGGHLVVLAPNANGFFSDLSNSKVITYNGLVIARLLSTETPSFNFAGFLAVPTAAEDTLGAISNSTSLIAPISFTTGLGLGHVTIINGGLLGEQYSIASKMLIKSVLSQENLVLNRNSETYVGITQLPLFLNGTGTLTVSGLEAMWLNSSQILQIHTSQGDQDLSVSNLSINGSVEISYDSSITITSSEISGPNFEIEPNAGSFTLYVNNTSFPVLVTTPDGKNLHVNASSLKFSPLRECLIFTGSINQLSVDGQLSSSWVFFAPGDGTAVSGTNEKLSLDTQFSLLSEGNTYLSFGVASPIDLAHNISQENQSVSIISKYTGYIYLIMIICLVMMLVVTLKIVKIKIGRSAFRKT